MGKVKRTLSILLSVAMVVTCVPQTGLSALAANETPGITEAAGTETAEVNVETPESNSEVTDDADAEDAADGEDSTEVIEEGGEAQTPADDEQAEEPADEADTPAEVEEPAEGEDVEDPAIDAVQKAVMEDETDPPAETKKRIWVNIDNGKKDMWTLTKVEDLTNSEDSTYLTVGTDGTWPGFVSTDGKTNYSNEGIEQDALNGKILAFGVKLEDGYKFASKTATDQVKATLIGKKWTGDNQGEKEIEKDITVKYENDHYEINLGDNIQESDFTEYDGLEFTVWADVVEKTTLTEAMVTLTGDDVKKDEGNYIVAWEGTGAVTPDVEVKDGETVLTKDTNYTVTYVDNDKAGTAKVIVTGMGDDYKGSVEISFTIAVKLTNDNCTITVDPDKYPYTGEAVVPTKVTVTYKAEGAEGDGEELTEGKDYTVAYDKNTEVGENAEVIITGKGGYAGSVTKNFTIEKAGALTADPVIIYADKSDTNGTYDLSAIEFKKGDKVVTEDVTFSIAEDDSSNKKVVVGDVLDADNEPAVNGSTLSFTLASSIDLDKEGFTDGTIVLKASFTHYADCEVEVTVKAVEKTSLTFKADPDTQTYAGKAIDYDADKITQDDADENKLTDEVLEEVKSYFTYSYTKNSSAATPKDVGTYDVAISLTNHVKYKADFIAQLTIDPKEVTLTPNDKNYIVESDTLPSKDYTVNPPLYDGDPITKEPTFTYKKADGTVVSSLDDWKALEVGEQLTIEASDASAGPNYTITCGTGTVIVRPDKSTPIYTYNVTLHNVDHNGKNVVIPVQAGQKIDQDVVWSKVEYPAKYTLMGWYKDEACTKAWNFNETVQADTDLYSVWVTDAVAGYDTENDGIILQIRDIPVQSYTGNKIQPNVQVYDANWVELKKGKDYTITYTNNINADADVEDGDPTGGYMGREGQTGDGGFNAALPYVTITGKGNYAGTKTEPNVIKKNFSIAKANIGDGDSLAAGFTMKYTNQFVAGKSDLKPFTSLKYKKAMTLGKDYSVTIKGSVGDVFTKDADGNAVALDEEYSKSNDGKNGKTAPVITKGYFGDFTMIVKGMEGNYTGEVEIPVVVAADSSKLLKNAKINLGSKIKSVDFSSDYFDAVEEAIILPVANVEGGTYYKVENGVVNKDEAADKNYVFTVSFGKGKNITYLDATEDYEISYSNNDAVGKATLTITAAEGNKHGYVGSVSTTFTIKGKAFTNKGKKPTVTVTGIEDKTYTGKPITMNEDITVATIAGETEGEGDEAKFVPEKTFTFGQDYTVKYTNNIKKGKATVTFTANPKSGYTGSFKETFKIVDLSLVKSVDIYNVQDSESEELTPVNKEAAADGKSANVAWSTVATYNLAGSEIQYYLKDAAGNYLRPGTDFTAKYANNKAITTATTKPNKMPTLTITGKGNYSGKIVITFTIVNGNKRQLVASAAATQYKAKNTKDYKPAITVKNGAKAVNKKEYEVTYANNTQAKVTEYLEKLAAGTVTDDDVPTATIKIKDSSSFYTAQPEGSELSTEEWDVQQNTMKVDLPIYKEKLTAKNCTINLTANPSQYRYTGEQVTPQVVSVMYKESATVVKALELGDDVEVSYGANIAAGKNKGTVTVTGLGIYGGSVTKKFNINTSYIYKPTPATKTVLDADNTRVTLTLNGNVLVKDEETGKYPVNANSDGSAVKPTVKLEFKTVAGKKTTYTELFENDTYTVEYGANNAVGDGTVTIKVKESSEQYSGTLVETLDIQEAPEEPPVVDPDNKDLANCTVILYQPGADTTDSTKQLPKHTADALADYDITVDSIPTEGGVKPEVVVMNGETKLDAEVYTVTYADNEAESVAANGETSATVATVTIKPVADKGFEGEKVVKFWITVGDEPTPAQTDIKDCVVVVTKSGETTPETANADGSYDITVNTEPTGTDPLDVTLVVKSSAAADATELVENTDYTVAWSYETTDGTTTGTATITAAGENYTGTKTVKFNITVDNTGA